MNIGDAIWFIFATLCVVGVFTDWTYRRNEGFLLNLFGTVGLIVIWFAIIAVGILILI